MRLHIIPFQQEMLAQAGELLSRRHRRDRAVQPDLPAYFEDPAVACKAVKAALNHKHSGGFAAMNGDRLVAYLIGDKVIDNLWGRSAWVRLPGCAYDPEVGVEIVRDLYAALGAHWVSYGIFFHFALVPVTDPALVHAWFSLSFGIEQVHALSNLEVFNPALPSLPPDIEIRKAGPEDRQHVIEMSDVIWKHQVKAPVWGVMMPETVSETVSGWASLVDEADVTVWLAMVNGQPIGIQGYWPAAQADDNLVIPERCDHLSVAGTRAGARGQGIGTLLTQYGLAQARAEGNNFCETDWRSTNLLASRFWPRYGFQPTAYRLVRRIDNRIAWADGSAIH